MSAWSRVQTRAHPGTARGHNPGSAGIHDPDAAPVTYPGRTRVTASALIHGKA
jgi:hypothetical protein